MPFRHCSIRYNILCPAPPCKFQARQRAVLPARPHGEERCEATRLEPWGRPSFETHRAAAKYTQAAPATAMLLQDEAERKPSRIPSAIRPRPFPQNKTAEAHALLPPVSPYGWSFRHLALVVVLVLVVLDDGGDGLQPVFVAFLHRVLQIEVLDRDVVGPELEVAAHRLEVGLLGGAAHLVLLGEIALHRLDDAVEQRNRVISLRAVERRVGL